MSAATNRRRLLAGLAAPFVLWGFIHGAAAVTPDYSHFADTVSQLAAQGRPHRWIMSLGFIAFGVLVTAAAAGVFETLTDVRNGTCFRIGLVVFGSAVALTGCFGDYDKTPGIDPTFVGHLHNLFAQVAVVGLLIAMFFYARAVRYVSNGLTRGTVAAVVLVSTTGLLFLFAPQDIEGLVQRGLYLAACLWLLVICSFAWRRGSA